MELAKEEKNSSSGLEITSEDQDRITRFEEKLAEYNCTLDGLGFPPKRVRYNYLEGRPFVREDRSKKTEGESLGLTSIPEELGKQFTELIVAFNLEHPYFRESMKAKGLLDRVSPKLASIFR